ncbi:MAG: nucleotide sugar dehydrogenase [bacterium]|nr:nucleotide sugar dehydrogenase [bacterium]
MEKYRELEKKISERKAVIGVVGLGYVGLPLVEGFIQGGFKVIGVDNNLQKVKSLNSGKSYVQDVSSETIKKMHKTKRLFISGDFNNINKMDVIIICVPTPLRKSKDPDISYILSALGEITKRNYQGSLVILESTTYPGTTEEILLPELSKDKLKVGKDFFLAFSPERVDPGNRRFGIKNTPKVVGGITPQCTKLAGMVYSSIVDNVHVVSSPTVAETSKLLENVFRSVNIGLVNELALLCNRMKIDVWEVIAAASTKPFGFMTFYPGPVLGGHCIPLDPFYLSWKARTYDFNARFIELAGEINGNMPYYVISRIYEILNRNNKTISKSKILLLGMAYKGDIDDMRESPSLDVFKLLVARGAKTDYFDPYIPSIEIHGKKIKSIAENYSKLKNYDLIVILTGHKKYDYTKIKKFAKCIYDTRNAIKGLKESKKYCKL